MYNDECKCDVLHGDAVERAQAQALPPGIPERAAEFFKVFGDPSRIRILQALWAAELCVCDLSAVLGMSQSAVSHQLRTLKNQDLVGYRREGKVVFYRLKDHHVGEILGAGLAHIQEPQGARS